MKNYVHCITILPSTYIFQQMREYIDDTENFINIQLV